MPGLKKICANYLITIIDSENVIDLVKISRTYNLPRIEVFCCEFIARHLQEVSPSYHRFFTPSSFTLNLFTDSGPRKFPPTNY